MSEKKPLARQTPLQVRRTIETKRLRLRMFQDSDLDDLASLVADPAVVRYVGQGEVVDRVGAKKALVSIIAHWDRHGFGRWAVESKATREFVGFGGLRSLLGTPELVYHFGTAYWGKGFATELGRAGLSYGFEEHRFARIVAIAKPENAASIHVMEKLGMRFEMKTSYYGIDVVQYAITADEFEKE